MSTFLLPKFIYDRIDIDFDVHRDFSLFQNYSDSRFGFHIEGTVFGTLSVQISLIFDFTSLLLIFTEGLLISYHL